MASKHKCECGRPATCFGEYEGNEGFSCDTCCGHGNEDGVCIHLDDDTEFLLDKLFKLRDEVREEREAGKELMGAADNFHAIDRERDKALEEAAACCDKNARTESEKACNGGTAHAADRAMASYAHNKDAEQIRLLKQAPSQSGVIKSRLGDLAGRMLKHFYRFPLHADQDPGRATPFNKEAWLKAWQEWRDERDKMEAEYNKLMGIEAERWSC